MPWLHSLQLCTLVYLFLATCIAVTAQDFTDAQIDKANMRLAETARARCVGCNVCATVSLKSSIIFLQLGIGNQGGDHLGAMREILCLLHGKLASTQ